MASAPPSNCSRVLIRTWTMQPGLRKTHARVTLQFKIKAKKRRGKWHLRLEIAMYKCLKTSPLLATNLDTCLEKEIVNCLPAGRKVLRVDGTTLNGHRHVFWSAAVKCPSPEIFVACFSFLKWHWMSLYECFGLWPKCLRAICPSTCRMRRSHDAKCDLLIVENISNCTLFVVWLIREQVSALFSFNKGHKGPNYVHWSVPAYLIAWLQWVQCNIHFPKI